MHRRRFIASSTGAAAALLGLPGCGGSAEGDEAGATAAAARQRPLADAAAATAPATTIEPGTVTPAGAGWVPQPGELAIVRAANSWTDIDPCPQNNCGFRYGLGSEWHKVINDYSGGVYNPWWGELGALMFFGGGHSATNDNSVAMLDFNDLRFKLAADPSRNVTGINRASAPTFPGFDTEHGEYFSDGKPASGHTYDTLVMLPPEVGGAPYGSLLRPFGSAQHVVMARNSYWAHKLDLNVRNIEAPEIRRANEWSRFSVNGDQRFTGAGGCAAYDERRQRVWWFAAPSAFRYKICYTDIATRQQLAVPYRGTEALFEISRPIMQYLPRADWLAAIGPYKDAVVGYTFDPDQPGGWTRIAFSQPIPFDPARATPWVYVPELDRIILFTAADRGAVYEIEIPASRADNWQVTRRPFANGAQLAYPAPFVGKRFAWSSALRCIVYKPLAATPAIDQFYAYRPLGV